MLGVDFDPGALLARSYQLPRGPRVRLRLARLRDLPAMTSLLAAEGHEPEAFALSRVLRSDPRSRLVMCATALVGPTERIVGVGEIELGGPVADPVFIVVDSTLTDGLEPLLRHALLGRAAAIARGRAA